MPGAPINGMPRESQTNQSRDLFGIVKGFCGYRARGVSIRGLFVLSRNLGYKTSGGCHVAERSSEPL